MRGEMRWEVCGMVYILKETKERMALTTRVVWRAANVRTEAQRESVARRRNRGSVQQGLLSYARNGHMFMSCRNRYIVIAPYAYTTKVYSDGIQTEGTP